MSRLNLRDSPTSADLSYVSYIEVCYEIAERQVVF